MIQSATTGSIPPGWGLDHSVRFGSRGQEGGGSGVRAGSPARSTTALSGQLTREQQQQVQELQQTDRRVRTHEQAHLSVGADLVRGGPSYSYQTGPDGRRYAVGGEVSIDASPDRTPEDTIPKAQHIRATALAPVDPSPQDHSVAAQASRMESEARRQLAVQQHESEQSSDQGRAGFYRGVQQSNVKNAQVGASLDIFA